MVGLNLHHLCHEGEIESQDVDAVAHLGLNIFKVYIITNNLSVLLVFGHYMSYEIFSMIVTRDLNYYSCVHTRCHQRLVKSLPMELVF